MLDDLPNLVLAVGALGTASYGLVDVSKAFGGGVSNYGFARIAATVRDFYPDRAGPIGLADVLDILRAGWLNGKPMTDQMEQARHLIELGFDPATAPLLAAAADLDPARMATLAAKLDQGQALDDQDTALKERFHQIVALRLDGAYQHADQLYRNAAKAWAVAVSLVLALAGGRRRLSVLAGFLESDGDRPPGRPAGAGQQGSRQCARRRGQGAAGGAELSALIPAA